MQKKLALIHKLATMSFTNGLNPTHLMAYPVLRAQPNSLQKCLQIPRAFGGNHSQSNGRTIHKTHAALQEEAKQGSVTTNIPYEPHQTHQQQTLHTGGGIDLILGPMFAGKTKELLRRIDAYEAQSLNVAIVKSDKDGRYSVNHVATHDGLQKPCFAVPTLATFIQAAGPRYHEFDVIAIDEAQFFADLTEFCTKAADIDGKRIVIAGLDGDFQRRKFGRILDLIPLADTVLKLRARCRFCEKEGVGHEAVFSLRIAADTRQELIGGADVYAAVCRRHYVEMHDFSES